MIRFSAPFRLLLLFTAFSCAAAAQQRTQAINVTTATVAEREVRLQIASVASVATDQATQTDVTARFAGWAEQVFANTTYQPVRLGDPLVTIYSPDIYAAEQDYLFAARNQKNLAASTVPGVASGAASLLADARARLVQQQVPTAEIARLERTGVAHSRFTLRSPESGIVVRRDVLPQMQVQAGARLFELASLSPIWVVADVNESDLGQVRAGQAATVRLDAFPGRSFAARVAYLVPQVDAASRTGQVRLVLANAGHRLVPGMYGSVSIAVPLGRRLVVPANAVLQTGNRALVFVDQGNGHFHPQTVVLGPQLDDSLVIRSGLHVGQRVATSAAFLLDSESQLAAAASSFAPPPPGVGANATPLRAAADQLALTTNPTPPRVGLNQFRLRLTDPRGAGVDGAQVALSLFMPAMPAMGMAAMRIPVPLTAQGGGYYQGSAQVGAGVWRVTIIATRSGQVLARQSSTLQVGGGN